MDIFGGCKSYLLKVILNEVSVEKSEEKRGRKRELFKKNKEKIFTEGGILVHDLW